MTKLDSLVAAADVMLLDFDGPVCRLFSGYPATEVAKQLRAFLADRGASLPTEIMHDGDPLNVLRWAAFSRPDLALQVEDLLCAAEARAVCSAAPTPFARDVIVSAKASGRTVAIVSNNSEPAIRDYLAQHGLAVAFVAGRAYGAPEKMKPNPDVIERALGELDARSASSLLIGDSVADLEAARLVAVPVVGYAKRPDQVQVLVRAGAEAVIESMGTLAAALKTAA
jgi:phosphoglycolate phosphatase-like HAD superfamily hydrolase